MKDVDYNKIAKLEQAISKKYGKDAIKNPKSGWDQEKEKKHVSSLKKFYKRKENKRKLSDKPQKRTCPVCKVYSWDPKDDIYMSKFDCCFKCFIQYVEDREERWLSGWRPE